MRVASIKPKLALRSFFTARSEGSTPSAFGTVRWRKPETVLAEEEGARDESVVVVDESASAMLWAIWREIKGETFNTVGRLRRDRRRKAKTMGLRALVDGFGLGTDGGGRESVRQRVPTSIFMAQPHSGRGARARLSSPSSSSF